MQVYAIDDKEATIWIGQAVRGCNYFCPECLEIVRARQGEGRRPHFYHLHPLRECRSEGKGPVHLAIQQRLCQQFPLGILTMEKRFPAIGRVADLVWEEKQLVVEVQCAAMTKEEMEARTADYQLLGYQVWWILHDQRYNKKRVSALEAALAQRPYWFTNIDAEGRGMFYRQESLIYRGIRVSWGRRQQVFPQQLGYIPQLIPGSGKDQPVWRLDRYLKRVWSRLWSLLEACIG